VLALNFRVFLLADNTAAVTSPALRWAQREGYEMKKFASSVKKFIMSEDGPTAVEYAVMLALIIVVCLAAVSAVGSNANAKFDAVSGYLT
jgi:pilus assembly protein Flp/PilA